MRTTIIIFLLVFSSMSLFSQTIFTDTSFPEKQLVTGEQPIYHVAKAKSPIVADGKMDEECWQRAEVRTLDYFFRRDAPVDVQQTKFRMLYDDQNLYLFYEFEDFSLTARETQHDGRTYIDDCAEFFVVPIPDSAYMHYGFEVNIWGVKYDYIVLWQFHGRNVFIPDYNPQYEVGVTYEGTINDDTDIDKGWNIEFVIPLRVFSGFNTRNLAGQRWAFQVVRQDRNKVDDRFRSTSTLFPTYDPAVDVHPPNRFGLMEFMPAD